MIPLWFTLTKSVIIKSKNNFNFLNRTQTSLIIGWKSEFRLYYFYLRRSRKSSIKLSCPYPFFIRLHRRYCFHCMMFFVG